MTAPTPMLARDTPKPLLGHVHAIDAIRGLGVMFVLFYHHGSPLLGLDFDGVLPVATFFTLSGFLITRLALSEMASTATFDPLQFYRRRLRRLMPAALIVLATTGVAAAVVVENSGALSFWAMFWAIAYGQNIYLLVTGTDYTSLFSNRSPVTHMWSLSLEEQVFLVFPWMMRFLARRNARALAGFYSGLLILSFGLAAYWAISAGNERAYFAFESRSGEFFAGALFAVLWVRFDLRSRLQGVIARTAATMIPLLIVAQIALWWFVHLDSPVLFRGGTLINSTVVCALMAFGDIDTPSRRVFEFRPLAHLGKLSYGFYLIHWPLFLLITPDRINLGTNATFIVRLVATWLLAELLFRTFEDPIRRKQMWKGPTFILGSVVLAVIALIGAAVAEWRTPPPLVDTEAIGLQQAALGSLPDLGPNAPTRSAADPELPARVLFVGDSQSWAVGGSMKTLWGNKRGVVVESSPGVGCGFSPASPIRYLGVEYPDGHPGCREWRATLPLLLDKFQPQVVVVVGGLADASDHWVDGEWAHVGDEAYDERLSRELSSFVDMLTDTADSVVWTSLSPIARSRAIGTEPTVEENPERIDALNDLIRSAVADRPAVTYADMDAEVDNVPGGPFNRDFRPDGAHMDIQFAPNLVEWLGEAIRTSL